MTKYTLIIRLFSLVFCLGVAALVSPSGEAKGNAGAGQVVDLEAPTYVVVVKAGASADALAEAHHATHTYASVFQGFAASLNDQALNALKRNPNVERIDADISVQACAETLPLGVDRIDADQAHLNSAITGQGVRVAVIDSGIQLNHPDLVANIDTALSRTFVSRGRTTTGGDDDHGHGTHVAGTIAAISGNSQGVVGVAPDASLIALKVLNKRGSGSGSDIIAALDYITSINNSATSYLDMIHVANCSFGGSGSDSDSAYRRAFEACESSGCFIAVAAGNSSADASTFVPAAYDCVFTVSAMDASNDNFASFSNYGLDIDATAPGVSVYSTYLNGGYATMNGTSMASPHVAGAAALYVSQNLSILGSSAPSTIHSALTGSGESVTLSGDPDSVRESLVDAEALLGPIAPPSPAVVVAIATDKGSYSDTDTQAVLSVMPTDEYGNAITGLTAAQLVTSGATVLSQVEISPGVYQITIDISRFSVGTPYNVSVTVTDNRSLSGSASVTIQRSSAAVVYVASIGYRDNRRNLFIDIDVDSTAPGIDLTGTAVSIDLYHNGNLLASGTGTTDSSGSVSFRLRNAPNGSYSTVVTGVSGTGVIYDSSQDAADPGHTR